MGKSALFRANPLAPTSEDALHLNVVRFLNLALTSETVWFHVPNGIRTGMKQAAKHKKMGMKAGVSDLIFCHDGRHLEIELKMEGKYLRPTQRDWRDGVEQAGGKHATCRSLRDVEETLREWGVPLKVHLRA